MKTNGFPKEEHLISKKDIETLFKKGCSFMVYPLRITYMTINSDGENMSKFMVSAPKKHFHHAVDRNRQKRLMRETLRKNRHELMRLLQDNGKIINTSFALVSKQMLSYNEMDAKMKKALSSICSKIDSESNNAQKSDN